MTQTPAGWYPDPDPAAQQGSQRYWDGNAWTAHTQPPSATAPATSPDPYQQSPYGQNPYDQSPHQQSPYGQNPYDQNPHQQSPYGQSPYQQNPYQQNPYQGAPMGGYRPAVPTTPDGQPLAGWWQRVAAAIIDSFIVGPLAALIGLPFLLPIFREYAHFTQEVFHAAEAGTAVPNQADMFGEIIGPLIGFVIVSFLVSMIYHCGMLKWKQATVGKLAMGLRVRLRESAGPLSWGTILLRFLTQNWASLVSWIPVLGTLASFWPLIDSLWPLWDDKKQALHDKAAKTNVVRVR